MADREIVALNETTPRLEAPQAGDRYVANRDIVATQGIVLGGVRLAAWPLGAGAVADFNGRTGNVVPVGSDYPPSLIGAQHSGASAGIPITGALTQPAITAFRFGFVPVTGVLIADTVLEIPAGEPMNLSVLNSTTGDFSLIIKHPLTAGFELPRGIAWPVISDGTTVQDPRAGSVLQVVHNQSSTALSNATTALAAITSLTINLTKKCKNSMVIARACLNSCYCTGAAPYQMRAAIYRDTTLLGAMTEIGGNRVDSIAMNFSGEYVDNLASLTSRAYTVQFAPRNAGATMYVNAAGATNCSSSLVLMEVKP